MKYEDIFDKLSDREIDFIYFNLSDLVDIRVKDVEFYSPNQTAQHHATIPTEKLYIAINAQNGISNSKPVTNLGNSAALRTSSDPAAIDYSSNRHTKEENIKQSIIISLQPETFTQYTATNYRQNSQVRRQFPITACDNDVLKKLLTNYLASNIPSNEEVEWITKNQGAKEWVSLYVTHVDNFDFNPPTIYNIMQLIDNNHLRNVEQKKEMITTLKKNYFNTKLKGSQLSWIKNSNESQIDWATEYLIKQEKFFKANDNCTKKEKLRNLLNSISILYCHSPDSGELTLRKLKSSWQGKKHRDANQATKNLYFPINRENEEKLKALAKNADMRPHEYLTILINEKHSS